MSAQQQKRQQQQQQVEEVVEEDSVGPQLIARLEVCTTCNINSG